MLRTGPAVERTTLFDLLHHALGRPARCKESQTIQIPLCGRTDQTLLVSMFRTEFIKVDGVITDNDLGIHYTLARTAEALRHGVIDLLRCLARGRTERQVRHWDSLREKRYHDWICAQVFQAYST